ncbi:MAG: hypothetical protein AVDCRST_MAG29-96 [uncultured Nocardioidaceae bacterium]|uniref:Uncharacterized protein n=1 Tax=uncultured Nocardioidaceae bacterium TaxID=253824 RepID=A0A6J4KWF6_9ACTN|nr:MAG: hypothetical protein AVDCRST_MAG29-96 [uncultured Nocardioidaceae bacterium]
MLHACARSPRRTVLIRPDVPPPGLDPRFRRLVIPVLLLTLLVVVVVAALV